MGGDDRVDPTQSLVAHARGDPTAADDLLPLVYDELRRLAARYMQQERPGQTLQPTALVHEAYLRLVDISQVDWRGKTHFYAMAARQMRRILVERARRVGAAKRGGRPRRITLSENVALDPEVELDLLALDQALKNLARRRRRQAQVAELRLFGGLSVDEVAFATGLSAGTVKRDWRVARAWLSRELAPRQSDPS